MKPREGTMKTYPTDQPKGKSATPMIRRIDPDFTPFVRDFLARKAWLPWVEREVLKLFAVEEPQ